MRLLVKLLIPTALFAIVVFAAATSGPLRATNAKQPQRTLFSRP
jgi:hypothetical protein